MNKQWEVGKTYKAKSVNWTEDYVQKLRFNLIGDSHTFTVDKVLDGDVYSIEGIGLFDDGNDCWFLGNKIEYFEEILDVPSTPTNNGVDSPTSLGNYTVPKGPVVEWLDKYCYVFNKIQGSHTMKVSEDSVYLFTDFGDIRGTRQVVEFINNRYSQLKSAENQYKLKELQAKKDKLMLELADVDSEIEQLQK